MIKKDITLSDWDAKKLGGSWKRGIVNPDLEEERKKCTFDQTELYKFMFTDKCYNFVKQLEELIAKHPDLMDN
jgi:hypothetical protein